MLAGALSVAAAFMLMVTLGLLTAWYNRHRDWLVHAMWGTLGTAMVLAVAAAFAVSGLL